jgi:uncharacterized membrane protein YkgB
VAREDKRRSNGGTVSERTAPKAIPLNIYVTLSFLVTTPEAWVPALGDVHHGFPYLSGVGRLIIKDATLLGAAVTTLADSAKAYVKRTA